MYIADIRFHGLDYDPTEEVTIELTQRYSEFYDYVDQFQQRTLNNDNYTPIAEQPEEIDWKKEGF